MFIIEDLSETEGLSSDAHTNELHSVATSQTGWLACWPKSTQSPVNAETPPPTTILNSMRKQNETHLTHGQNHLSLEI